MTAAIPLSTERPNQRDGCLLLWLEGNVIFSLNESGLTIWSEIERKPQGASTAQLVESLQEHYVHLGVSKARLHRDVEEFIAALSNRGFVTKSRHKRAQPTYRIKNDVFRTDSSETFEAEIDEEFVTAVAYQPNQPPESTRLRAFIDTVLGLVALISYEIVLKTRGFAGLCLMVEHWRLPKRRSWLPLRIRQICASMDRARLWYPKQVLCLQHSAVVTCLLRRQGIPAQMVFGARRKPFYAHAWCEVYGAVVNDDQSIRNRYRRFMSCLGSPSPIDSMAGNELGAIGR